MNVTCQISLFLYLPLHIIIHTGGGAIHIRSIGILLYIGDEDGSRWLRWWWSMMASDGGDQCVNRCFCFRLVHTFSI